MNTDEKPRPSRPKARWINTPKLTPDAASRQGKVTKLAFEVLGGRDEAIAYLNTACVTLGGRPLDLAVDSAEGLGRVEHALAGMKSTG
ncbi:MbcA/ParS/Xre antitoxin family protein [Novosphingobium panipatense]|uniref:MbcA/ParS/Xre antitoxin family protein n=1 Tax=Novosphingobium TaxID=165696 RepID=UPI000CDA8E47|nr:antitoxin Xre/MbcA/ParS toxin-binding domain-containing protein [Novosphingobium sp. HII-3]